MPILSSFGGLAAIGRGARAGAGGRKLVQLTISANTNNYVLNTSKVTGYEAGNTDVELTINAGVVVGSASTGSYAFDVDTSWNVGDTVKVVNNGSIGGRSGNGGVGASYTVCSCPGGGSPGSGGGGGTALRAQRTLTLTNNGVIAGGGGGGGGGGKGGTNGAQCGSEPPTEAHLCGSGGGAGVGVVSGTPGNGGTHSNCNYYGSAGVNGNAGSGTNGGARVALGCDTWGTMYGGSGGNGGTYGSTGSTGGSGVSGSCLGSGASGGAAGACTSGNANITWLATGTRYGALN